MSYFPQGLFFYLNIFPHKCSFQLIFNEYLLLLKKNKAVKLMLFAVVFQFFFSQPVFNSELKKNILVKRWQINLWNYEWR